MSKAPSEKHLENWIVNNFNRFGFPYEAHEGYDGFDGAYWVDGDTFISPFYSQYVTRQFPLAHGIADLILQEWASLAVVELKKGAVDADAMAQCARYMFDMELAVTKTAQQLPPPTGINENLWEQTYDNNRWGESLISGCVVGHSIDDMRLCAAMSRLGITFILYDYDEINDSYSFELAIPVSHAYHRHYNYELPSTAQRILNEATNTLLTTRAHYSMTARKDHGDE